MANVSESNRFSGASPRVIGHRGAAGHAPENTLASIRKAAELGATWVEFDVKLSADGVPVLCHDDTLERTTDGRGRVAARTARELARLDAGGWFDPAFAGEPLPTLDAALAQLAALGLGANVEIKPCPGREAETGYVAAAALAADWPSSLPEPLISSFSTAALNAAAGAAPAIPRALLVYGVPVDWRGMVDDLRCVALHAQSRRLRRATAKAALATGMALRVYTVNRPGRARQLMGWGVDAIITDYPDRILSAL
ncbi:MAG: glycerophosphodiester phosphodiesterase [Rhodospirillaceae bacterium]